MSLIARHLEANGIPTVIMGCARDIVERCGVARFIWSDLPLGNSCGRPFDVGSQRTILGMALDLLESARAPRTTVQTPYRWGLDDAWKDDFWRVDEDPERMARQRAEFDRQKAIAAERRKEAEC